MHLPQFGKFSTDFLLLWFAGTGLFHGEDFLEELTFCLGQTVRDKSTNLRAQVTTVKEQRTEWQSLGSQRDFASGVCHYYHYRSQS
jgi:hypothetical protein